MKIISKSLKETEKIAREFIEKEFVKNEKGAIIVRLYRDLGSGKTAFTQATARCLGVKEAVTSPTFVIEKIYKLEHQRFDHLIHIDAYRLGSGDELLRLGWEEIAKKPKNIILIEWPERIAEILPEDFKKIYFTFVNENTREISF